MKYSALILFTAALLTASIAKADSDHEPIGDGVADLPLFDAHIHYKEPAWAEYSVENIIEIMDRNGVAMGLVSSTPDEGTIRLWEYAPNRIVPELRPYHDGVTSQNWAKVEGIDEYLKQRLEKYPHEGIGEFHIHRLDKTDDQLFRKVITLAKERDIFLHVHSDDEAIKWLYSLDADVKIIWAHAGLGTPVGRVYDLMKAYPSLMADTSLRERSILSNTDEDGLNPEWKKVIIEFQYRLMVGSDTWINGQWERYDSIMDSNREWLSKLPRSVAEKIAYKNAEKAFNRTISMEQIGKR